MKRDRPATKNDPKQKKQKINTIPIRRGKFKSRWLAKHASLLRRPDKASGLLVSCGLGVETRAMGQVRDFLDRYLLLLFPDYQSVWERFDGNLDVDESFLLEGDIVVTPTANKVAAAVATEVTSSDGEPSSPGTENIKKDRTFQAVDAACGGRVFHRFRVNVTPVEFMCKVFDYLSNLPKDERVKEHGKINHCARFIPLNHICSTTLEDIETAARRAIEIGLPSPTLTPLENSTSPLNQPTVAIVTEIRNNVTILRDDIIKKVANFIPAHCKIQLANPDFVIFISIFKSVCGLSILPDYYKYKKYNLGGILEHGNNKNKNL